MTKYKERWRDHEELLLIEEKSWKRTNDYKDRNGDIYTFVCYEAPSEKNPLLRVIVSRMGAHEYRFANGRVNENINEISEGDIVESFVEAEDTKHMYINIYSGDAFYGEMAWLHRTREAADNNANDKRIACVRVEYVDGEYDE